jgi:hypothetical protein
MARTVTKKRAATSDSEPETASKRVKSAAASVESDGKDDDGNPFWEVRNFDPPFQNRILRLLFSYPTSAV